MIRCRDCRRWSAVLSREGVEGDGIRPVRPARGRIDPPISEAARHPECRRTKKVPAAGRGGNRIRDFLETSWESRSDSGLADLFSTPAFIPIGSTSSSTWSPRPGSSPSCSPMTARLPILRPRSPDSGNLTGDARLDPNIICYLGLDARGSCPPEGSAMMRLNPCLVVVSTPHLRPVVIS